MKMKYYHTIDISFARSYPYMITVNAGIIHTPTDTQVQQTRPRFIFRIGTFEIILVMHLPPL